MPQRFLDATRSEWHLERDSDALVLHLARPVTAPLTVRAGGETVAVVREASMRCLAPSTRAFATCSRWKGRTASSRSRAQASARGPRNFRDLGGYPTHDGGARGQIFRAGSPPNHGRRHRVPRAHWPRARDDLRGDAR
jgi:hypothetical protein